MTHLHTPRTLFLLFASSLAACSTTAAPSSGEAPPADVITELPPYPDFAPMARAQEAPSGSFDERSATSYFTPFGELLRQAMFAELHPQSSTRIGRLEALARSCDDLAASARVGRCPCPLGGSLVYETGAAGERSSGVAGDRRILYRACRIDDLEITGAYFAGASEGAREVVYRGSATLQGVERESSTSFRVREGRLSFVVDVDEGAVVFDIPGDFAMHGGENTLRVHAKNGDFDCTLPGSGAFQCSGAGGKTFGGTFSG